LFTGTAVNSRVPTNTNIMKVLYQFETTQGQWEDATISSGVATDSVSWEASALDSLTIGFHSLYVVALDSTSGTINKTENFTGGITPYYFLVKSPVSGIEIDPDERNGLKLSAVSPFINSTVIAFILPAGVSNADKVELKAYNVVGRAVKEFVRGAYSPGQYMIKWNGDDDNGNPLPSGPYFLRLKAGELTATSKVIRLR
jgi:hypothetical protein